MIYKYSYICTLSLGKKEPKISVQIMNFILSKMLYKINVFLNVLIKYISINVNGIYTYKYISNINFSTYDPIPYKNKELNIK